MKNHHSKRNLTLAEACRSSTFCLKEEKKEDIATYNLKKKHDYFLSGSVPDVLCEQGVV